MALFPVEINRVSYEMLLRVPGIGVKSAKRIVAARKTGSLDFSDLKRIGVVLKRAQYFLTCKGKLAEGLKITESGVLRALVSERAGFSLPDHPETTQLSLFTPDTPTREDVIQCLTGQI